MHHRLLPIFGVLLSTSAWAGTFDANGVFSFDPKAVRTESFASPLMSSTIVVAGDALEGTTYANVNTKQDAIAIPIAVPQTNTSYRARMFVRKGRVVADLDITYPNDGGSPSFYVRFYPTGRITSDGWYEVTTNLFSIEGTRKPDVQLSLAANVVDLDAFELVPEGAYEPLSACSVPHDSACTSDQFCSTGWCRNGNAFVPPLPPTEMRDRVVDYFAGRIKNFFGGRYTRANTMPVALATLEGARGAASPWEFWNAITYSLRQLHDWHTTINGPVWVDGRGAFPICVVEGDGDLSHNYVPKNPKYWDVIVSHVGPKSNSGLKPGDRIVAINGVHPIEFIESLEDIDWGSWRADDPDVHAEAMERFPGMVRRFAKTITVIRCNPQTNTCSSPETIDWKDLPPDTQDVGYPYCDQRPQYHIAQNGPDPLWHNSWAGPFYGVLKESGQNENLWGGVWNDVYLANGPNEYKPMIDAFAANANGVVLDHRLGNGGTVDAAEYLTTLFRTPDQLAVWPGFNTTLGMYDNFTNQMGLDLVTFYKTTKQTYDVGSNTPKNKNMPTALVLSRDGSASDWFPFGMQGLPNVRLFGRRTAGAFSSYFQFDYYGQLSWRMASGDLVRIDGTTHLGEGVIPDEEIVPKQSDLLVGKDTVFLRAIQWIRTCQGCR